jgi:adenylate cyclase
MKKTQLYKILFLISYWLIAVLLYVFFEKAIEGYVVSFYRIDDYVQSLTRVLIIAVSVTIVGASVLAFFEVLYFNKILRKRPLGIVLLIKTGFYLLSIFLLTSLVTYINLSFIIGKPLLDPEVQSRFINYLSSVKLWVRMVYWSLAVISALFIINISEKLGQGVLFNYLLGKYHSPKEETRIFMFLDLTSSSLFAEKLGHIKYSQLLQDVFSDLTDVVSQYNVQVYQYVGDEVVLSWKKKIGYENNNCIKTFFAFQKVINEKSDYYNSKYGIIPQFKAGLNSGFVTIAEVGEMKKELAYHGDAINTAAHIRSVCGEHKKKLLISADLLSYLPSLDEDFEIEYLGVYQLKGKRNVIGLFSVEESIQT